jgi:hypothetical protein
MAIPVVRGQAGKRPLHRSVSPIDIGKGRHIFLSKEAFVSEPVWTWTSSAQARLSRPRASSWRFDKKSKIGKSSNKARISE